MKLVADNIRITKAEIQKSLNDRDPLPVRTLAQRCAAAGAHAIDINTGPLKKNPESSMTFFVRAVQSVTDLPLVIDTTNPLAMAAGLEAAQNPVIINGISLEPEKLSHILPLAARYDADIVGFLLAPDSRVPRENEERFEIALALVGAVEAAGISPERLILDPVVPPLSWDDGLARAREVLETVGMLPELLGFPVRTMAGLSNLTTGAGDKGKKNRMEIVYLSMLAAAGLDYLMLDILNSEVSAAARAADLMARGEIFSWAGVD
ncbi:MAG TPA: dihydropteroate synthase [Desulfobacteraceae bacterium]|nr:dihydropteroate synthase [Desulfobacteraceae bacterium]